MTRGLRSCQTTSGMASGTAPQPPGEDSALASRTTKAMREPGSGTQAMEPPDTQPGQAREVEPKATLQRSRPLSSPPRKGDSPRAPLGRSHTQAPTGHTGRVDNSPQQLCTLSISGSRARPALDETPEGPQREGPRPPEAEAPPAPEELSFQRCFQETPSSFTSTNYTSPNATPGPPPLRAPQSSEASPCRPASYSEFQASGADAWLPAAENNFPGASFRVLPTEPEPFPKAGSPRVASFQIPFPALPGAGPKPFPEDTAGPEYSERALVFAFHQPRGEWQEEAVGTGVAYPLPTQPAPLPPSCFSSQPGHLDPTSDLGRALPTTGAACPVPSPFSESTVTFPDSLHKSLTTALPERPPSAHNGLGSPRGAPNSLPQRHFPGQAYGSPGASGVGTSPSSLDTELANPGPPPTRLPQLKTPGPGEKLVLRNSPGQHSSSSPGLFTYNGLQDPGAQPLFFGVAQPQVSPQGTPSLPPPRLVGASPSESPLPSPATNTAGSSTCSSLSPLSSSPANPSSEESQVPGPLGPSSFFHPPSHPQENSSPFPSPDPSHALPIHYQPEPVKTFPFPTEVLGAEGTFKCLEEVPFPSAVSEVGSGGLEGFPPEPPPYSAHHFPLSSASLDQLDVLLTCKQCDRNYSSLATFLEHRQFCSLLLARTKDSHQQPSEMPRPSAAPSVLAAPKAPDPGNPSLLNHTKTVPFLLGGDLRVDGKDDPLRTTFLPNLTTAPFPLSAADLDLEDDAKLDSLITEALNGLEYQSDNPEIDSSFIDVFADEEPSGPRGTSAGLPPKTRVGGAMPENKSHHPLPTMEPQAPHPGDGGYTACSRPKTRSLGPVPAESNRTSLASQQRRGKQFKFSQGELDTASTAKRSGRGTRASCLRPRRRGKRAEPAPHRPRDLRTQALKSHTDPCGRLLPVETRSSKRLRLSLRKDSRRRKAWGGTWSKELIHKIVQQKNQLHKQQAQQGQGSCFSLATERPAPSTLEGRLQEYDYASESEEEDSLQPRGSRLRGRPRHGSRRWRRGEKRKEMDLALGPREERKQQKSRKVVRQETTKPGRPCPGPSESPEGQGPLQSPETVDSPKERDPKCLLQIPTSTKTPEENHPSLDFPQEDVPPDTTKLLRDVSGSPPSTCVEGSLCPPAPEQPQPGREDATVPHGSSALPGAGSLLGVPLCTEPPISHDKGDPPACLPGELLVPITDTTAAYPEPSTLFLKTPDLGCDSALFNRDSLVPAAKMEPQPYNSPPRKLLLGPKDLAGCFPKDLYSKPLTLDSPAASSRHLCQEGVDPSSLKPKPPRNPPYTVDTDPGKAESPLTLESTPLLSGLPMDEFDSPIYSSLSGNGDAPSPPTRIDPPARKPQLDPSYPSFLPEKDWSLLEEVSPVLSSHLDHSPDRSGAKVFSKRCPRERTTAATPPPLPCKVSECGITFMSSLPEDELEIKRLVTELESQLQSKGEQEAPGELRGAQHTGRMRSGTGTPLPIHQAASPQKDSFSTADLTDLGELSPHQEGAETAVATTEGTLGSPQEEWPSFHLREAAPPPASHKDQAAGASFRPAGASPSFQPVQNTRVSRRGLPEAEEGCRGCPEACLPDPGEPLKPASDRGKLVKCSPNHEPLFPKNNKATGIHYNEDVLLLLPCTQTGGSCKTQGPGQDAPELEGLSSPVAHLAPDLAFQGAAVLHLGASPPTGTSHSEALKGHSLSSADGAEETGPLHPAAGSPGSEGNKKVVPAGASPSPGCIPNISPGWRPQDPAESPLCQLQLLVAGAAENEDDDQSLQGPQLANTQSSQQSNPSDVEGDIIECGNVAQGPGKGSDGGVQVTAISEMARCQLRPEAGGHLGSLSQAEKLKGPGEASQLQPDNWGSLGSPDNHTTVNADPETTQASPAGAAQLGGQVRGSRPNLGLQNEAQSTPSPSSSDVESLVPVLTATHVQNGPEDWTPEVASPGLKKHLLLNGESAELPMRDLASCAPLPISAATPVPCSLEHLLQEDPPTVPSGDTISSCLQGPLYNPEDRAQEHGSVGDPLSLFDDEASFSQLFPLGNHLTRKKNPRVYGKRCKKPKPPPLPEPWEFRGSETLPSAHMPTDLSDSGSLCLSLEDPWSDEAMGLPESFLLEGFLSSKMPGIDPWAPGPSLWALEPDPEADGAEQEPSCSAKDHPSENIPELHMVPAAWRGLELQAPADETASSLGDMSPEPPNLEQEHYNCGLPGNAVALERLSTRFEMQDICFLGPCEDPVALSNMTFLDFKATVNSQGSRSKRPEEVAKAKRAPVRDRNARAKRTPYKCRVCFQRFHGLGELDLHKLAHSPSPPPTCYMCVERRFGSRELLREHLQEKHVQGRAGLWACGMCLREVADVWMYNEHLREHALRFARKGPARRSLGDPSGSWEGDSTVTHFLSSMMGQASKPHRGKCSVGQANGGPAEREKPKPKARTKNSNQDGTLVPDSTLAKSSPSTCANPALPSSSATLPGSTKTCPSLSPAPRPNREPLPHTVPVHQDCKDPSRDCHHCGKRFPKPFKLQRHLAVHSPQRVFLCPQCPRVYPEPCELRAHLAREHGVREELELQHTPLYDCELCANVTHISKRSFICSSCNYTFAKKEQFDRHMDKHLRRGQQPFTFRGVRRPGASGQKTQAREGSLPSKRRRVATPSSAPGPVVDRSLSLGSSPALSEASMPALLQPCLEAAPGGTQGQPRTPERPMDLESHLARGNKLPSDSQEFILPSLSPFPAASADGKDDHKPDQALESPPDGASPGSPGPLLQQALPLEGFLPQPGPRGQASESLFSGKGRTPSAPGKCAPDHHPEAPSMLRKEKQASTCHMASEGDKGVPSHKGSATKHGSCQSSSKDRPTLSIPGKAPKVPVQSKKAAASPKPGEPARSTEDRQKPTALKAKPGPSSQGSGGPQHSTKTAGGSQPQPASGQLQSETATTPSKPNCPAQSPAPDKPPTRAPAKGYSKAPREAGDQGPQGSLVPREDREGKEKKRKGRALGPSKSESVGSLGRAPSVPDKPRRAPRKQAAPSRVLPAKPRPGSQSSITLPQPSEQQRGEPSHTHRDFRRSRDGLGKAFPQARPLHRTPKRGRAVRGADHANPRACWTAESQSDLLSQLFGQRLTSFKIPLKKDSSE
ncbi:Zinc finger protein 469 [Myotis davidii]|uniref:Zinc finger protein 469 n=1 Tax=Myotis davidii TaxID=225400 RepID=L5LZB0_MYODS|nr:Zinc finger protein 469 [Myotis davidii]